MVAKKTIKAKSAPAKKAPAKKAAAKKAAAKKAAATTTAAGKAPAKKVSTNKTQATSGSVAAYIAKIADAARRADAEALVTLMHTATGEPATMWGTAIVGFGSYHYVYESGREGDSCIVGFAARASEFVLYLGSEYPERDALMAQLGPHKTGKACLYLKTLAKVDTAVLARMVAASYAHTRARWQ